MRKNDPLFINKPFKSPLKSPSNFKTDTSTKKISLSTPIKKNENKDSNGIEKSNPDTLKRKSTDSFASKNSESKRISQNIIQKSSNDLKTPVLRARKSTFISPKTNVPKSNLFGSSENSELAQLIKRKKELQSKLQEIKDNTSLLQTALRITKNNRNKETVDSTEKWKAACIAASERLFVLLQSTISSQLEAKKSSINSTTLNKNPNNDFSFRNQGYISSENPFTSFALDENSETKEYMNNDNYSNNRESEEDEDDLYLYMLKSMGIDSRILGL
ncbi:hypothetical protein BB559_001087 [Furculomyces boomerangus]|uniref:Uncharacterized protein n=2 Tax=Harpellales TaxID=61421 RepID=A0A2T9Z354_9FUNG|nr:hypothetical protein BB559_001087 [Furculomyces boomerangus]PWA03784.1 hypothetical protein BB558_000039 [Smittium angustum]